MGWMLGEGKEEALYFGSPQVFTVGDGHCRILSRHGFYFESFNDS